MKIPRPFILFMVPCLFATFAIARVGETEQELVHRYGDATSRQPARKSAQGRTYTYSEYLNFLSEDWTVRALVINGRCEEINYSKRGDWTEAQFKHLLEINGGRSQWEEQQNRNPELRREWKRRDKTTARWGVIGGLEIKTPLVEQTRGDIEKQAKKEASKLPKFYLPLPRRGVLSMKTWPIPSWIPHKPATDCDGAEERWARTMKREGGKCIYCDLDLVSSIELLLSAELDHLVPKEVFRNLRQVGYTKDGDYRTNLVFLLWSVQ